MSAETTPAAIPPWVPSWLRGAYGTVIGDRDIGVMMIVATLLYTVNVIGTIGAMRYLLPPEAAVFSGFLIVTIIFLAEAKYIARHAPFIRKLVVIVFIPVTVLAMHSSYYNLGASLRDAGTAVSQASSPYSDLVNAVYAPNKAIADSLARRAEEKYAASERERTAGSGTGRTGYGPRAQALQREGDELRDQAAPYQAKLDPMRPYAELDPAAIGPEKTYEAAIALWRVTPEEWKTLPPSECAEPPCSIPKPDRLDFVDEAAESPLLTPMRRVFQGDWLSILLLILASGLDGLVLALGTAIVRTDEPATDTRTLVHRAADMFVGARQARKTLQYARQMPVEHIDIRDPLRTMHVRVVGERHSADFWNLLYRHTHPLSGRFDWAGILQHENESYVDMARWWIDAARANGLLVDTGAEDENEALYYPKDSYYPTTNFYREMHLREINHRDQLPTPKPDEPAERVMRVLLPDPIKRKPGEPVELMRPLPKSAGPRRMVTSPADVIATGPPPHSAVAAIPTAPRPPALAALRSETLVPAEPATTARAATTAHTPSSTAHTSPMAFARGGGFAHTAQGATAPALRVVTPPPPEVGSVTAPVVVEEPTVESLRPLVNGPPMPDEVPGYAEARTITDGLDEPAPEDDELADTDPSIMLPALPEVPAEIELEPTPVPAAQIPPAFPELDESDWVEKPTATRSVPRGSLRAATQDGNGPIRDDALRIGSLVRLAYLTRPPMAPVASDDPHAPVLRAHLRSMAAEALRR